MPDIASRSESAVSAAFLRSHELGALGLTRRDIARHVAAGRLIRVRRDRYVRSDTSPVLVTVARLGARIDCVSLLRLLGVFVRDHTPLHVQVSNGASRLPTRPAEVVCHWRVSDAPPSALLADIVEALAQACRCQEPRAAIATLDSAWHKGLVDEAGIAAVFARLPAGHGAMRPLLDPRSESGTETLVRLMLRGLGCSFEIQVRIVGVGRVDFVVDGWLIVECDSREFHEKWDAAREDRRRDLAAAVLGYTTIRLLAEDILYNPEWVLSRLKGVLAAHGARRDGHNSSEPVDPGRPRPSSVRVSARP